MVTTNVDTFYQTFPIEITQPHSHMDKGSRFAKGWSIESPATTVVLDPFLPVPNTNHLCMEPLHQLHRVLDSIAESIHSAILGFAKPESSAFGSSSGQGLHWSKSFTKCICNFLSILRDNNSRGIDTASSPIFRYGRDHNI